MTQISLDCGSDTQEDPGYPGFAPVCWVIGGFQRGFELAMETFYETVCDRVVGSCSDSGCTKEMGEGGKEVAFELSTPIGGNHVWNTKSRDPMGDESLGNGFRCDG